MHTACDECDTIVEMPDIQEGEKLSCQRCGAVLRTRKKQAGQMMKASFLTACLLYYPANFLPMMSLEIVGLKNSSTVLSGITALVDQGYWWMAFLVFLCSMLAPLIQIVLCGFIAICRQKDIHHPLIPATLKFEHHIKEWGMLEVYLIGVFVSFVKLIDMGALEFNIGLFCFVGLMLSTVILTASLDHWSVWRWWETRHD